MTKNQFNAICAANYVDSAIALESDAVRSALAIAATYPACMHEDAIALIEDVIAGEF